MGTYSNSNANYNGKYIYVFDDGDIIFKYYAGTTFYNGSAYSGKVAETFDSYPYTIKLIVTNVTHYSFWDAGTITFNNATNCEFNITNAIRNDGNLHKQTTTSANIQKISDIVSQTKEEIWKTLPWW
ncbi:hypothetical protein [Brachyspira sp.]|uniref:hypothetical protein n=1 Tax=Brachyspira sp. TaxID=1977261 RepID=UPI003D7CE832